MKMDGSRSTKLPGQIKSMSSNSSWRKGLMPMLGIKMGSLHLISKLIPTLPKFYGKLEAVEKRRQIIRN